MTTVLAATRAELTRIITMPSVVLGAVVLVALHVLMQAIQHPLYADAIAGIDEQGTIEIFTGSRVPAVPEMTEQLVAAMFTPIPFVAVLGALVAGAEFRSGEVGISLTAVPSRRTLVVAKAAATAVFVAALSLAFAVITTLIMLPAVRHWNPAILVHRDVLAGYGRATLVAVTTTLVTVGITLIARRALVGVLCMALLLGLTITQVLALLSPALDAGFPISAARNLLFFGGRDITPPLTSGPWVALAVLLAWAALSIVAAVTVLSHRDAR